MMTSLFVESKHSFSRTKGKQIVRDIPCHNPKLAEKISFEESQPRCSSPKAAGIERSKVIGLTSSGRFMKGSDLLRSAAFSETNDCCCVTEGAKAEADAERRARIAADFIMVDVCIIEAQDD